MGGKRSNRKTNRPTETEAETVVAVEAATEQPQTDDAELDAALALLADEGGNEGDGGSAFEAEDKPTATDEGENVVIGLEEALEPAEETQPADVDAALKELEVADQQKAASKSAPKGKKATEPTVVIPVRAFTDVAAIDEAELKSRLDALNAKKVHEKVQNLIQTVEGRKSKLSRYTRDAVKLLAKDGKVSGKSLVEMFMAEDLSVGTARAQAQQMTALFKVVGAVAPTAGDKHELAIADQGLVDELVKLAA